STLATPAPLVTPLPSPVKTEPGVVESTNTFQWSEKGAPVFTIDTAVITALQQNPAVLQALEEIRRTKGVIIQIRAQALPHIGPSATMDWTAANIRENGPLTTLGMVTAATPRRTPIMGIGGGTKLATDTASATD